MALTTIRAPHAGFGDQPNSSIKFEVLKHENGTDPEWTGGEAAIHTFQPRHTSNIVVQVPNERAPRELTCRLLFGHAADMETLDNVQGAFATLRIPWGITSTTGGAYEVIAGVPYLSLPTTQLVRIEGKRRLRDGRAIATATFRRSAADASYYGYATYAEDVT